MKPTKQIVYLPLNNDWDINITDYTLMDVDGEYLKNITEKEGYFFTPEQLNEYTQNVIKQTLFSASEFAELQYECGKKSKENCLAVFCGNCTEQIDRQSITNTFEETYQKFKV